MYSEGFPVGAINKALSCSKMKKKVRCSHIPASGMSSQMLLMGVELGLMERMTDGVGAGGDGGAPHGVSDAQTVSPQGLPQLQDGWFHTNCAHITTSAPTVVSLPYNTHEGTLKVHLVIPPCVLVQAKAKRRRNVQETHMSGTVKQ